MIATRRRGTHEAARGSILWRGGGLLACLLFLVGSGPGVSAQGSSGHHAGHHHASTSSTARHSCAEPEDGGPEERETSCPEFCCPAGVAGVLPGLGFTEWRTAPAVVFGHPVGPVPVLRAAVEHIHPLATAPPSSLC